jgi:hypothetical protein
LRIKEPARPASVSVEAGGASVPLDEPGAFGAFDGGSAGWAYEEDRGYLWVQVLPSAGATTVRYAVAS